MFTLLALLSPAFADSQFQDAISRTESMVWNSQSQALAARHGLSLVNVTWEDTGRSKGSSVGPNISDLTIGVRDSRGQLHPMPVFRFDNFHDVTADLRSDRFFVRVGNEDDRPLHTITLENLLRSTRGYLHDSHSWSGSNTALWASRDAHVLVSAQAAFLPVPRHGQATFTPVIYNYQSSVGNPAVLTIVATREGTSMQVIENDNGYMSEVLYFNEDGQRAPFTATRLSDFQAGGGDATSSGDEAGLNVVLVVQVPLKHREPQYRGGLFAAESGAAPCASQGAKRMEDSDMEVAVIGHGETEGPFREFNHLPVERDTRFPVRVTVQFYQATSNGIVSDRDVAALRRQIDQVYANADYVGSLVTDGYTVRPTEWIRDPVRPVTREDAQWSSGWWGNLKSH